VLLAIEQSDREREIVREKRIEKEREGERGRERGEREKERERERERVLLLLRCSSLLLLPKRLGSSSNYVAAVVAA
jgi:hypothetical protein